MATLQTRPARSSASAALSHWPRPSEGTAADESRLLMLAESVGHMGHWHWNLRTDKVTWSEQVFEIHGVDPASLTLTFAAAVEFIHADDRAHVVATFDDAIQNRTAFEFDCRILRRDGVRTIICKGQPEYDSTGAVTGLFGVIADVTDAFAAIRAIHDQKEMLSLAAHLAHLGHWIWAQDEDRLTFCSEELARIHGMPPEAMTRFAHPQQLAATAIPADRTRYAATVAEALAAPRAYEIEYQIESAGGGVKDIREIGQPMVDEHGKLRRFIATVQDISETKRREKELARAEAELQESNRQKDKLFSIIAHDLRSPFNSVMGFADLLAESANELPRDRIAEYARIVRDSAGDVQTLLDNLLTWASIQIRDAGIKFTPLDLGAAAARSVEPLAHMAEEKRISIANNIVSTTVMGDADLICIVLRNLVSNAIKFCKTGGAVRLSAAPGETDRYVTVTVSDDGIGMSRGARADLFAIKCTTPEAGTLGEKGTGLGLYLCRDIVDRHGGEITVDSEVGRGTAIHFTLPTGK